MYVWAAGLHPGVSRFSVSDTRLIGFFDISDELFPPQFCYKFDIIKSIWVNCVLQDEACEFRRTKWDP